MLSVVLRLLRFHFLHHLQLWNLVFIGRLPDNFAVVPIQLLIRP